MRSTRANDNGQNVPADTFVQVGIISAYTMPYLFLWLSYQNYLEFLGHLRKVYKDQPFLILTPVSCSTSEYVDAFLNQLTRSLVGLAAARW